MLIARHIPYRLVFKRPSRTSRAVMLDKDTFFVEVHDTHNPALRGIGEVALFRGLSSDDTPEFEQLLDSCCRHIHDIDVNTIESSAIRFGLETALADLRNGGSMQPFSTVDTFSIPINGLVWMNDRDTMTREASEKIGSGFRCIKLKIGGINFDDEVDILRHIRRHFGPDILQIRLDANGAFTPDNAMQRLDRLSKYDIHSIEQPIAPRQYDSMARICQESPIPIALDEDLIGITPDDAKSQLLQFIKPQYIILKPSLCGGFSQADKWIEAADSKHVGWWATSALESNIGLNAIARWVTTKSVTMPQGLGTGALYINNVNSPLEVVNAHLQYNGSCQWSKITF